MLKQTKRKHTSTLQNTAFSVVLVLTAKDTQMHVQEEVYKIPL